MFVPGLCEFFDSHDGLTGMSLNGLVDVFCTDLTYNAQSIQSR